MILLSLTTIELVDAGIAWVSTHRHSCPYNPHVAGDSLDYESGMGERGFPEPLRPLLAHVAFYTVVCTVVLASSSSSIMAMMLSMRELMPSLVSS